MNNLLYTEGILLNKGLNWSSVGFPGLCSESESIRPSEPSCLQNSPELDNNCPSPVAEIPQGALRARDLNFSAFGQEPLLLNNQGSSEQIF